MPKVVKKDFQKIYSLLTGLTGLEPATSAVTGRCSNQLNYSPLIGNFLIMLTRQQIVKQIAKTLFFRIISFLIDFGG
jgi:hypothetical protein